MGTGNEKFDCLVVGGGFTGLVSAWRLSEQGFRVAVVEKDSELGGLAQSFRFADGVKVERFYHHLFRSDRDMILLLRELGLENSLLELESSTGVYFNQRLWNFSSPMDLLRFQPLSLIDRIRLGIVAAFARIPVSTETISSLSVRQWLEPLVGQRAFRVVWQPLLDTKFGEFSERISAEWLLSKLRLRGGSRKKGGQEHLFYLNGGFEKIIAAMERRIRQSSGRVLLGDPVLQIDFQPGESCATVVTQSGAELIARSVLVTAAPPIAATLAENILTERSIEAMSKIRYLANKCLVLRLGKPLSDTYWINVNDPGFPFVGVIEHTNLDKGGDYAGDSVVYLSRYLATSDPVWSLSDEEFFNYCVTHLKVMFPSFDLSDVREFRVWAEEYAQPVVDVDYRRKLGDIPSEVERVFFESMANVFPEDRGTNYAVRAGYRVAQEISRALKPKMLGQT